MLQMKAYVRMAVWFMSIGKMEISMISSAQWWVQCENIIGHIDLYQYFRTEEHLQTAIACWNYVAKHLLDAKNGEWHWAILENGMVNKEDDKAGFWKCPYHNSRMCLELIERDY